MKVNIGKPKDYFGPYQLARVLCFFAKKEVDRYGFKTDPKWVNKFGEWLAYGSISPEKVEGERYYFDNDRKLTLLAKGLNWLYSKNKQTKRVTIDYWDSWDGSTNMAHIILPLLKSIQADKHGAPHTDNDDVPENLRCSISEQDEWGQDDKVFERWDYILNEMIFAFEHIIDDEWQFPDSYGKAYTEKTTDGFYKVEIELTESQKEQYERDKQNIKEIQSRVDNGLRLFGKYYLALWT